MPPGPAPITRMLRSLFAGREWELALAHAMDIDCARSGMPFHCIEVALAAADARVDIIQFPVLDLVRPVRICDETVANRNQINQTVRNGLFSNIRVVEPSRVP